MNRKFAGIAIVGAAALALAGCSNGSAPADNSSAETGELTVWLVGTDTPAEARAYLKSTFESENEGWTLKIVEKTWADTN